MTRIEPLDPSATEGATRTIFERVERGAGRVPNALRVLGRSPAALQAWWDFERALARGSLPLAQREQLALLSAATNDCAYCLGLHTTTALLVGVDPADIERARQGRAGDPVADAVLRFGHAALRTRGDVEDDALAAARSAGLTDAQLIEVLAVLAINSFNNACNRLARTPADPPI